MRGERRRDGGLGGLSRPSTASLGLRGKRRVLRGRRIIVQGIRDRFFRTPIVDGIPRGLRLLGEILRRALLLLEESLLILLGRVGGPLRRLLIDGTPLRRCWRPLFVLEKNRFRDAANGREQLFDDARIGDPEPVRKDLVRGGHDKSVVAELKAGVRAEPRVVTLVAYTRA